MNNIATVEKIYALPGEELTIGNTKCVVLESDSETALCITQKIIETAQFDRKTNNFAESELKNYLQNDFKRCVPNSALADLKIDLTTDDGLNSYGTVTAKIGLLTCDEYRRYARILEQYPVKDWWWLATAASKTSRTGDTFVRCATPNGSLFDADCDNTLGVRPVFRVNLDANII